MPESSGGASGASFLDYLRSFTDIGTSIFKGVQTGNAQQWTQGMLSMLYARAQQGDQEARDEWFKFAGPILEGGTDTAEPLRRMVIDQLPGIQQGWANAGDQAGSTFDNAGNRYLTPELQQYLSSIQGRAGGLQGLQDTATQGFLGGGWTPQYQQLFESLSPYLEGRGNNAQLALGDVGPNLIGQRGQTAFTQGVQDAALRELETGGMTPDLSSASQIALGIANSGGMTPEIQEAIQKGLQGLREGGRTPENQAQVARGTDLVNREALLPFNQAMGLARNEAINSLTDQAQGARRQAISRGAGVVSGSGINNLDTRDIGRDVGRGVASSMNRAMLDQQGLQQNQMNIGANLLQSGVSNQNTRFGQSGDLALGGTGQATSRMNTALSTVPAIQNAATGRMSTILGTGTQGGQLENSRMGTGAGMAGTLLDSQNAARGQFTQGMGQQNQYALGLGGLANSVAGTQGGFDQAALEAYLKQMGLGVGAAGTEGGLRQGALQGQSALWGNSMSGYNDIMQLFANLAGQQTSTRNSWVNNFNPYGSYQARSPWDNLDISGRSPQQQRGNG